MPVSSSARGQLGTGPGPIRGRKQAPCPGQSLTSRPDRCTSPLHLSLGSPTRPALRPFVVGALHSCVPHLTGPSGPVSTSPRLPPGRVDGDESTATGHPSAPGSGCHSGGVLTEGPSGGSPAAYFSQRLPLPEMILSRVFVLRLGFLGQRGCFWIRAIVGPDLMRGYGNEICVRMSFFSCLQAINRHLE